MTTLKALKHKYCLSLGTCLGTYCTIYRPNSYHLLVCEKSYINLFKYANTKYNPIKTMSVDLVVSETQCIIYRPDFHNSQASRKKLKK